MVKETIPFDHGLFSRYAEIAELRYRTAGGTVQAVKEVFARHGTPETVVTDNGAQFSSELFRQFAEDYQFTHITVVHVTLKPMEKQNVWFEPSRTCGEKNSNHSRGLLAYRATLLEPGIHQLG